MNKRKAKTTNTKEEEEEEENTEITLSDKELWNLEPRKIKFLPDYRPPKPVAPRKFNQYTTQLTKVDDTYEWLISITEVVPDSTRNINCWIPKKVAGIDTNMNYNRISFQGKTLAHRFVYLYHHPELVPTTKPQLDVSHLCDNGYCCRPSHLHLEEHNENIQRQKCLGYVIIPNNSTQVLSFCEHDPKCKKFTRVNPTTQIVNLSSIMD